ncbi:MAG TPA: hypothetical protein VLX91_10190 [Candidatus Acidoferrales bacterium]|nr:hypothetical protein [Candidatus Acidoferrales bacterium]
MSRPIPSSDSNSLLVPIHLDAWSVDSQNQQNLAWYYADFTKLAKFQSPMPEAFDISDASKPEIGVHLHWALPDALTHGTDTGSGQLNFPYVPNRWLVARFNTTKDNQWQCRLWVVQSDYLGSVVGVTSSELSGNNVTSIPLASGSSTPIAAGTELEIIDPNGIKPAAVIVASAVKQGDQQIAIQAYDFSSAPLGTNSVVRLLATSSFLHPFQPTTMNVGLNQTTQFNINNINIGNNYSIEAWDALQNPDGQLFLTAVGPGNVSFAAYVPGVKDVFSFTDTDVPPEGTGVYTYTYMVVGWYSDPANADPLRGVNTYVPGIWKSQIDWQNQTPAQRLQTLLNYLKWSVQGTVSTVPATSLYQATVVDVQWPPPQPSPPENTQVAVANTSIDALAALIQWQAQQQGESDIGDTLAALVQASMYDLLNEYGKPGSNALIRQRIQQAWYGSDPGGTIWEVVSAVPQSSGQSAITSQLTPEQVAALNAQLAALNQSQSDLDEAQRQLESLQSSLYMMWMKVGVGNSYSGWVNPPPTTNPEWQYLFPFIQGTIYPTIFNSTWNQYCLVNQAKSKLPSPTDSKAANDWANSSWTFPTQDGTTTLADLSLALKASPAPRFWHPVDPVLLICGANRSQKHGEDGRYNKDGTLTCRLPGQTITGVQITGQPAINMQTMTAAGVNLNPCGSYSSVPGIPSLTQETFFVDPMNSTIMAKAVGGNATAISQGITSLLGQNPGTNSWIGKPPVPFALVLWSQAWAPLFLEWELHYFPTGTGQFSPNDWSFDGEKYVWQGTGFNQQNYVPFKGRTTLTPQVALVFKDKIENYLKNHPDIDSQHLEDLISTVANWDILSQSLSGLTGQLVTLLSQEAFPPTPSNDVVQCPAGNSPSPSATALIGDQYHNMPLLESSIDYFYPVRGGFVQFQKLQIVDAFGQTLVLSNPNTPQGFLPLIGSDLIPSDSSTDPNNPLPYGSIQFTPRIVQSSELDVEILANDVSGKNILVSGNPNPVCGWLLPNHLDGGISVYDENGILLGELLPLPVPNNWRPRPGASGITPPPAMPKDIPNETLRNVVVSIAAQTPAIFKDFLKVIDETLWMVDPLGGRKDQYLSVLIGRPLAVIQVQLNLELRGEPIYSQLWDDMATGGKSKPPLMWTKKIGEVENVPFPVRLGSLELRNDGLIGYFLPTGEYTTFYSVHTSPEISKGDMYIKPIMNNSQYQGDITLQYQGPGVTATLLMDPRGCFHAYTAILPVKSVNLPANLIENFIRDINVTFQTGPIIADPGTLRIPRPAEQHGVWNWIQAVPAPQNWEEDTIVNADDQARMPDAQLQLREGWLQLSGLKSSDVKSKTK